jgi:hypothetical protein
MKRRRIDPELAKVSEKKWQDRIEKRARELGALTCHVYPARQIGGRWFTPTSDAGFPDLWCLWPGRLLVFECKKEDAPPSAFKPRQKAWIKRLQSVDGAGAWMVRPSDWPHVERALVAASQPATTEGATP